MTDNVIILLQRNIDGQPMSKADWFTLQMIVKDSLHGEPRGYTRGTYEHANGKESITTLHYLVDSTDHEANHHHLSQIARLYKQPSITYIVGSTEHQVLAQLPLNVYL